MSLIVSIKKELREFTLSAEFQAEEGITCLLGASGCGKSMTLKCIAGIEKPDEGHIELDGRVLFDSERKINLPPQKRNVGYLFQNYALFPNMTVRQNILCGLNRERSKAVREKKADEMIRKMQLTGLESVRPDKLSGGQMQRAALARILVSEPGLLMLDEPFSALDGYLRDRLKIELRELLDSYGKSVLMVTHSRDEAYNMSREIGVMERGRLLVKKPTKTLFADPESIPAAVVTGCKNIAAARRIGPHLAEVPEWGVTLVTAKELREDLTAVGIRAHYFHPGTEANRFPVCFAEQMEEPFETILLFRYKGQDPDSPPVWWRLPKEKKPAEFPKELGIAPVNVLPLYEV